MNNDRRAAIWQEIIDASPKAAQPINRAVGERTTSDLAAMLNVSRGQAERWAMARVKEGLLTKEARSERNHELNAWCPVPCHDNATVGDYGAD